jgi:hypothetical protein
MKMLAQTANNSFQLPPAPGKVLSNFPADTLFLASGSGLKQMWAEAQKNAATQPELKQALTQMQQTFQQSTQLNLDRDVLGWMGGEYGLAIVPVDKGPFKAVGVGLSAVFDSTDQPSTERAMQGLKGLAGANGVATAARKSNGKEITDLKAPISPDPILSYGWLDDRSMFVSMSDMAVQEPLNQSKDFQEITGSLPQNNSGYLYINFDRALNVMQTKLPPAQLNAISPAVMAVLSSMRGLGATATQGDSSFSMEGLLLLKPSQN